MATAANSRIIEPDYRVRRGRVTDLTQPLFAKALQVALGVTIFNVAPDLGRDE
jgi:hypothetical protein